jgi:signal transduction histidine kinase
LLTEVLAPWKERRDRHRFVRRIPDDLPPVLGDERLLSKCLDELLDNAVKFSPDGGTIELGAEAVPASGGRGRVSAVRLFVRDQGIGIEASQMGRLFQDFRQLDGSETRAFGGLGLGLSFARRVALAHHGDITAASEVGRGSTFALTLPAAQPLGAATIRRTRLVAAGTRIDPARKRVAAAGKRRAAPRKRPAAPRKRPAAPRKRRAAPRPSAKRGGRKR